jgi:DNA polymerase
MNPQNLSRGSNLRRAIEAPPGYVLVVCDLSQIENRVLAWICGFLEALLKFADPNYDPYIDFATKLYDVPAAQVQKHQRQVAKAGVLGLGYGMGWRKFILFAKLLTGIDVSEEEAKRVVAMYRTTNSPISRFWDLCQEALIGMANDPNMHYSVRGITFGYKHVMKPNGTFLNYHNLKYYVDDKDESKNGFMYGGEKGNWKYIYGGLLTENLVQSLARDIIADQAVRINDKYGYEPAHMVHDELIYVLPVDEAEQAYVKIQAEMCIPPDWCSDIPLNAEGGVAANYGEAK